MKLILQKFLMASLVAFFVTSYISFALVAINAGFSANFPFIWLRSWLIAFVMAVPSLLFVGPYIRKKFSFTHRQPSKPTLR